MFEYARVKLVNNPTGFFGPIDDDEEYVAPINGANQPPPSIHQYCWDIKDPHCSQTKLLVRELIDFLRAKSGQVDCSGASASDELTSSGKLSPSFIEKCVHVNSIVHYLTNERRLIPNKHVQSEAIESVLSAIEKNPHWNLRLLNAGYADTTSRLSDVTYVVSTIGLKSLMCRVRELGVYLYVRVVMLACLLVTLVLSWLLIKTVGRMRRERDQELFALVKQVTQLVERQYESSLLSGGEQSLVKPYLAISHIYDTLVEPSERASKRALWAKVVKFIQDHESRIHLETQLIDGEETHVWKWVVVKHPGQLLNGHHQFAGQKINEGNHLGRH